MPSNGRNGYPSRYAASFDYRGASPRSTAGATEVLPAIRREGAYVAASRDDDPETLMARALIAAKSALDRQAKQLEAQKPKVLFTDAVAASKQSILIGDLAKILR